MKMYKSGFLFLLAAPLMVGACGSQGGSGKVARTPVDENPGEISPNETNQPSSIEGRVLDVQFGTESTTADARVKDQAKYSLRASVADIDANAPRTAYFSTKNLDDVEIYYEPPTGYAETEDGYSPIGSYARVSHRGEVIAENSADEWNYIHFEVCISGDTPCSDFQRYMIRSWELLPDEGYIDSVEYAGLVSPTADDRSTNAYVGVYGIAPTEQENLPSGTVTYEGYGSFFYNSEPPSDEERYHPRGEWGSTQTIVDFDNGQLDMDFQSHYTQNTKFSLTDVQIEGATFAGGNFEILGQAEDYSEDYYDVVIFSSSGGVTDVSGRFYGPNGESLAGNISYTDTSQDIQLDGTWVGQAQ